MGATRQFAAAALVPAAAGGAALLAVAAARGRPWLLWGGAGWAVVAAIGLAGGSWLAGEHGKMGTGFLKALAAGMLCRLLAVFAGAALGAWAGGQAIWAWLGGAVLGYAPLQAFEVWWFYRRKTEPAALAERGGAGRLEG